MTAHSPVIAEGAVVTVGAFWNAVNGCYNDGAATRNDLLHGTEPLLLPLTASALPKGTQMCLLVRASIAVARFTRDQAGARPLHVYARPGWTPPTEASSQPTTPFLFEEKLIEGPVWLNRIFYTPETVEKLRANPGLNYDELDRMLQVWREEVTRGLKALTAT